MPNELLDQINQALSNPDMEQREFQRLVLFANIALLENYERQGRDILRNTTSIDKMRMPVRIIALMGPLLLMLVVGLLFEVFTGRISITY